jgi:hypothetical protein
MRLDAIRAISAAGVFAAALLLIPAAAGAESKLGGEMEKAGQAVKSGTEKAAKDVAEDTKKETKEAVKATEKDTESMFTEDGKPRPDDPFALEPNGDALEPTGEGGPSGD